MKAQTAGKLIGAGIIGAAGALWAIAPRSFTDRKERGVSSVPNVWYAHRGLHDAGSGLSAQYAAHSGEYVAFARRMAMEAGFGSPAETGPIAPENSLASFAAAAQAGYGIELDIQLTMDGKVVVVHDADLMRVAGDPRRVCDLTYDELCRIPLFPSPSKPGAVRAEPLPGAKEAPALVITPKHAPEGYYQHVPLFEDVLKLVDGRVPLIVEYKIDGFGWSEREEELMKKASAMLEQYEGAYVVESFHPRAMMWYRMNQPQVCRGQLAESAKPYKHGLRTWLAGLLGFDFLSRPDFVAYQHQGGSLPQVRLARAMGALPVSWTVRSQEELVEARRWFDRHIIESFVPSDK